MPLLNWVMLERVVVRRDDDSFPDESKAPVRATGITTWNARFTIAFGLAQPPRITHLYAQLPSFPKKEFPLAIVATHRHLLLLRVGTMMSSSLVQDFFIYNAASDTSSQSLIEVPPCAEPDMDYSRRDGSLPPGRTSQGVRRLLAVKSMGLLRRGEEEFVVAQLEVYKRSCSMVFADIYLFLKSAGKWGNLRLPILCGGNNNPKDIWQVCLWETDTVIPADRYLCWVDYERGILLYDVFGEPAPTVFFRRFPLDKFPDTQTRSKACRWLYRSVSAIDDGNVLMFIDVARDDDIGYGALKPGAGFTITCHTLKLGSSSSTVREWEKEYTVTSNELWSANPESLPHDILMFPQVDINMPHVVHFLIGEFGYVRKKMWLVTIDMNTKSMRNFSQYTHGRDAVLGTEAAYLTNVRSSCPMPFLPCELPKYLFEGAEYIE